MIERASVSFIISIIIGERKNDTRPHSAYWLWLIAKDKKFIGIVILLYVLLVVFIYFFDKMKLKSCFLFTFMAV